MIYIKEWFISQTDTKKHHCKTKNGVKQLTTKTTTSNMSKLSTGKIVFEWWHCLYNFYEFYPPFNMLDFDSTRTFIVYTAVDSCSLSLTVLSGSQWLYKELARLIEVSESYAELKSERHRLWQICHQGINGELKDFKTKVWLNGCLLLIQCYAPDHLMNEYSEKQ